VAVFDEDDFLAAKYTWDDALDGCITTQLREGAKASVARTSTSNNSIVILLVFGIRDNNLEWKIIFKYASSRTINWKDFEIPFISLMDHGSRT
jgi:hypothetical protein